MPLSWNEIKSRALAFSREWSNAANENSEAKPFWIDFFEIFGITNKRVATFELAVNKYGGGKGFVDLFWAGQLLVEHKSRGKNLDRAFDQALDYFPGLKERDLPHTLVVCDFARFRVHDLARNETIEFALADLHKHIKRFGFIAGYLTQEIKPQDPVNIRAAERMGRLHDALKASGYRGHALEVLLVRILFCLFAEDTAIIAPTKAFRDFIEERTAPDGSDLGPRLAQIFQTLNTPEDKRSNALDDAIKAFPYVNGKLFAEALPLADFTAAMREALLDAAALDWSLISPAVFGALFQSIMDTDARRNLGAHYTSEENILKLIKALFLDALYAEFHKVKSNRNKLFEFHKKLRTLTFFDPACGCGNFLVISYRELRLLELEVLRAADQTGQRVVDIFQLVGVNVDQFYGIEIEEFPAQIAQVALWLVDHQMNLKVSEEFGAYFARIPLTTSPHIVHGNALTLDWASVLPPQLCSYVLGNPPFVGKSYQSAEQKADFEPAMRDIKGAGVLDFVAAWYVKAARYIKLDAHPASSERREPTRCAFVSTNSITQGEQVAVLWGWLLAQGMHIHFAHRTFSWSNEARGKAAVHCVIIGFGREDITDKVIYDYDDIHGEPHATKAHSINPYLIDATNAVVERRSSPICRVPTMLYGSKPVDDGAFIFSTAEMSSFLASEPRAEPLFKRYMGATEFLYNEERWCLWLKGASPSLTSLPLVRERILRVRDFRAASKKASTRELAKFPTLFAEDRHGAPTYLVIPEVSAERRAYLPVALLTNEVVQSNLNYTVPNGGVIELGVLSSAMHAAWMRVTCGRLKSDFRYSAGLVYNNFPWPEAVILSNTPSAESSSPSGTGTDVDKSNAKTLSRIIAAAEGVLAARAAYPEANLALLYGVAMPPDLMRAHQKLDAAVDKAYVPMGGKASYSSDADRVAFLFELYQRMTTLLPSETTKTATLKPRAKEKGTAL